jgi:amidase/6-aminohexanoate-cyclic-dimer hydrolase
MYEEAHRLIQKGLPQGPFRGVPFLIKDFGLFYKGITTSFGSRLFRNFVPDHHSTIVKRYLQSGLVIFGKTNTPELGLTVTTEPELFGPCRNPWNLTCTCGGSSGGSAVAVASAMLPAAHASDGGGSIRIPASCCGLFGLKPTRGRIPMGGPDAGEGWAGMGTDHVVTRSVRDSAAFLDISSGPDLGDPYWAPPSPNSFLSEVGRSPGALRIAFTTKSPSGNPVHQDCISAVNSAVQLCAELGHLIEEAEPSYDDQEFQRATVVVIDSHTHSMLKEGEVLKGRDVVREDVEFATWKSAEAGRKITAAQYIQAIKTIHQTSRKIAHFFEDYDILLTPVLLQPPIPLGFLDTKSEDLSTYYQNLYSFYGFTKLFNGTGQPSMSVPLYWTNNNLPVGVQFTSRFGDDALLLRLAAQLEEARPWKDRFTTQLPSCMF